MHGRLEEIRDLAPGLSIYRVDSPDYRHGLGWEPPLTATYVKTGDEVVLIDPLAPSGDAPEFWERLDADPPTVLLVLKPDHVRDLDVFAERYGAGAYGPRLFWRDDVPETLLEGVDPGDALPGGLRALYDGRGRNETPVWLPQQKTIVFADALTAPKGELRIWSTRWHEERVLPAMRAMLDLPFERVIVSHGEPVHDRAAFEAALERTPWPAM